MADQDTIVEMHSQRLESTLHAIVGDRQIRRYLRMHSPDLLSEAEHLLGIDEGEPIPNER